MNRDVISLDHMDVLSMLPHRYPFLLIDRVIEINHEGRYLVAQKNVTLNEPFFSGHFPGLPIMPGVLILEALAQAGGVYIRLIGQKKLAALLNMNNVKFRKSVYPGDVLLLRAEEKHLSARGGKFQATAFVGEQVVCEAEIGCVLVDPEQMRAKS